MSCPKLAAWSACCSGWNQGSDFSALLTGSAGGGNGGLLTAALPGIADLGMALPGLWWPVLGAADCGRTAPVTPPPPAPLAPWYLAAPESRSSCAYSMWRVTGR